MRPALHTCLLLAALCLLAPPARAATNDVTTALQRGLFEEEANQNLGAAIQAYQTVANQFDKDRKLAATAIFRLGECYRKQGNTNDAATQYERILREFSDQPTLVTLSRQSLAGMGSAPSAPAATAASETTANTAAAAEAEAVTLEAQIAELKALPKDQIIAVVRQNFVNPVLTSLIQKRTEVEQKLAELQKEFGPQHTEVVKTVALLETINKQIDEQVQSVLLGLEINRNAARKAAETLKTQAATSPPSAKNLASGSASAAATSTEAEEVKRIQALIKDSPDLINAPDRKGETLLQSAAAKGKLAVVKLLLDSGTAVDGLQQPGLTPLHYAAANGHKAVVDLLLSKGAKADARSETGVTPLHLAAMKGYESVAKALLAAGAPVNTSGWGESHTDDLQYEVNVTTTPLHVAANAGYPGMVELLLAKGADASAEDGAGRTPLSYAARKHYDAVVQALLAAHANPNAGARDLPLAAAAYEGDMTALKLLLASGADPNTNSQVTWNVSGRDINPGYNYKFTPLVLAVIQRHADAVAELLHFKADPNLPDPRENPPLYGALGDTPTLKALLEGGANPNGRTSQGTPLLLQAVMDKNQPAVELLLAHQAEVNATNSGGWTPLHQAAARGDKAIAELLLKAGAAVNAQDKNGLTPLYVAVENRQPELAELLLANKADPNERNSAGQTPLDLAKSQAQPAQGQPPGAPGYPGMGVPARIGRPGVYPGQLAGTPATAPVQQPKPEAMADLLRRHGAVDDLPRFDWIEARRGGIRVNTPFPKGTHDWGQFTLLELIAVECGFLAGSPNEGGGGGRYYASAFASHYQGWSFPDIAHLRIRRPAPDQKSWLERPADLRPVLEAGECSKDVRLEWGDVVDIPEADHPLNERWPGFSATALANLKKCLTRQVEIVINGQATNITLAPQISNPGSDAQAAPNYTQLPEGFRPGIQEAIIVPNTTYWLKPVLLQSRLVLTSSDLRHVKVTRHDAASGQEREWVVDCSNASPSPDFWLRDGDKIEVPERTESASAEEATMPRPESPGQPFSQRLQSIIQRAPPSSQESAVPPPAPAEQVRPGIVQLPTRVPRLAAAGPVGKPPLFQALPDAPALKALLEDGADPNVRTSDGTPLLVQAVRDKNQVAVELLLAHQADVNAANSDGWTPLDYATADGLKGIVKLLLKVGASVNARNPSGETPLHIAVRGGQRELAELLLANKADPNVRNNAGETPLALAKSMGLSLDLGGAVPLARASESPQTERYLSVGGVLYSPKPEDPELLNAGYHRDRSAKTRKAECWEQRAGAELSGRACSAVWCGTDMIVFGGEGMGVSFDDGARYCLAEDTWALLPKRGGPSSRTGHAAVWTGKEMIIWGGFGGINGENINHNDGARYNPSSDTWKPVTTKKAPEARFDASAVWSGREMLVWGGYTDSHSRYQGSHADAHLNTGGRYDPSADSWRTITTKGAPSKRCWHTLVWTGKEMIVWGGANTTKALGDGGRYNPARDSWRPISTDGAPNPRLGHVAVWTGKEMIVWGGTTRERDAQSVYYENGARYDPETDTWKPISTIGAPKGRVNTFGLWTGTEMVIWGGVNDAEAGGVNDPSRYVATGARYNPATDTWKEMTVTGAPSPRLTSGVWAGEGLLTFGGYNNTHLNDTWFYSPSRTLYPHVKQ